MRHGTAKEGRGGTHEVRRSTAYGKREVQSARARVVTHEVRHGTAKRGESDARSAARTAKKGGA